MITYLQNKLLFWWAIITYSKKIIPSSLFKKEINVDALTNLEIVIIIRRSNNKKKFTFDKFDKLREDALIRTKKEIFGLSMNLLGGLFIPKHICYIQSKEAGHQWDGIEDKLWEKYKKYLQFKISSVPIYFILTDLHKRSFPYYLKDDRDTKKLIKRLNLKVNSQDDMHEFYGASEIKHRPNKLNYWHIEFVLFDIEDHEVKNKNYKSEQEKNSIKEQSKTNQAAHYALTEILLASAKKNLTSLNYSLIPETSYLN